MNLGRLFLRQDRAERNSGGSQGESTGDDFSDEAGDDAAASGNRLFAERTKPVLELIVR